MLKVADIDDLQTVKDMAMKFVNATDYKDHSDAEQIEELIKMFLEDRAGKVIILYADKGMIAGMLTPFLFGPYNIAAEVAWWVDPEERKNGVGKELLGAFEHWAGLMNAKFVSMSALDDTLGKFYEDNDYKLYERAYLKKVAE